jgi:hypothetical protein
VITGDHAKESKNRCTGRVAPCDHQGNRTQENFSIRYIHLNPLWAGLVANMKELDQYPWCGHGVLMNQTKQAWQNINYVHGLFGDHKREARKRYREFVVKGIAEGRRPELTGGGLLRSIGGWTALKGFHKAGIRVKGDERILGDSDFELIPQKA